MRNLKKFYRLPTVCRTSDRISCKAASDASMSRRAIAKRRCREAWVAGTGGAERFFASSARCRRTNGDIAASGPPAAAVTMSVIASSAARSCSPITELACRSSLSSWDRRMRNLTGCPRAVCSSQPPRVKSVAPLDQAGKLVGAEDGDG